jgi:hypothetical protein
MEIPFKEGAPYTLRLKMPDGYHIGTHWHPTDEDVTVLSGTLGAGMGDKFDPAAGKFLKPGGIRVHAQGGASLRLGKRSDCYSGSRDRTIRIHLREPGRRPPQ